jgi:hypothetical protein
MAAVSNQTGATACLVIGVLVVLPGVALLLRPSALARANDTKGPAWIRNWNRSPGQTTSPLKAVIFGLLITTTGLVLAVLGILGLAGVIHN